MSGADAGGLLELSPVLLAEEGGEISSDMYSNQCINSFGEGQSSEG